MIDRFINQTECNKRLIEDYKKHKSLVVAFDFDNTVYDYHKRGDEYPVITRILKKCDHYGFTLVCFTANDDTEFVNKYLKEIGINHYSINRSPIRNVNGKPYYNILLDDRAGLPSAYDTLDHLMRYLEKEEKNVQT